MWHCSAVVPYSVPHSTFTSPCSAAQYQADHGYLASIQWNQTIRPDQSVACRLRAAAWSPEQLWMQPNRKPIHFLKILWECSEVEDLIVQCEFYTWQLHAAMSKETKKVFGSRTKGQPSLRSTSCTPAFCYTSLGRPWMCRIVQATWIYLYLRTSHHALNQL